MIKAREEHELSTHNPVDLGDQTGVAASSQIVFGVDDFGADFVGFDEIVDDAEHLPVVAGADLILEIVQ